MKAVRGLLWEEWRQSRAYLATGAAVLCLFFFWARLVFEDQDPTVALPVSGVIALLCVVFLFLQQNLSGLSFAYPQRRFVLPVDTLKLTTVSFGYKVGAAMLFGALLSLGSRQVLGVDQPLWIMLAITGMMAALLAAGFSLAASRGVLALLTHGLPLIAVIFWLRRLVVKMLWGFFGNASELESLSAVDTAFVLSICAITIFVCWAICLAETTRVRTGKPVSGIHTVHQGGRIEVFLPQLQTVFWSRVWYEFLQCLWVLPVGSLVICLLGFPFVLGHNGEFALVGLMYFPVLLAFVVGHYLMRSSTWHSMLTLGCPLSTADLFRTKFTAGIFATLMAVGCWGLVMAAYLAAHNFPDGAVVDTFFLAILMGTVLSLFTGRVLLLAVGLVWAPLTPLIVLELLAPNTAEWIVMIMLIVCAIPLTAYALLRKALKFQFWAVWMLLCFGLLCWWGQGKFPIDVDSVGFGLLWMALLSAAPAWTAVVLDWQRHR